MNKHLGRMTKGLEKPTPSAIIFLILALLVSCMATAFILIGLGELVRYLGREWGGYSIVLLIVFCFILATCKVYYDGVKP